MASSYLANSFGNKGHKATTRHLGRPYLPHELLLTHSNPLSLHLDPLKPEFLLLLLLSGQRIGHTQEPCCWVLSRVVLLAQGTGCHLLLVLVTHHCGREEHRRSMTRVHNTLSKGNHHNVCALEYGFLGSLPKHFPVNRYCLSNYHLNSIHGASDTDLTPDSLSLRSCTLLKILFHTLPTSRIHVKPCTEHSGHK